MALAFNGNATSGTAGTLVSAYIERKRLAALGITVSAEHFSALEIDSYLVIDSELEQLRERRAKKAQGGRSPTRR